MDIIDKTEAIIEVTKMIQKEAPSTKVEDSLNDLEKLVVAFNSNFDQRSRVGLLSCWDFQGNLLPWEKYE